MKRNIYGLMITVISIVLVAVFAIQQLGGLSLLPNQSHAPDYAEGDFIGCIAPESGRVTDGKSALAAAAKIFGVDKDTLSVSLEDTSADEQYYKLQQMSGDLPVYGRRVNLSVDGGEVYLASGSLSNNSYDIDTTSTINEDSARESIYEYVQYTLLNGNGPGNLSVNISSFVPESLCIYDQGEYENDPRLAYDCAFTYSGDSGEAYVSGSYDVVIDAHSADVLSATSNIYIDTVSLGWESDGRVYYAELEQEEDRYIFRDEDRNLRLYDVEGENWLKAITSVTNSVTDDVESLDERRNLRPQVNNEDKAPYSAASDVAYWSDNDEDAEIIFSNVQRTYDFYKEVLGRKGYNNGNSELTLLMNHKKVGYTAYSFSLGNASLLAFEEESDIEEIDLIGHEFTHSVEKSISHMDYVDQSGAITEGYCDTFGELIELYTFGSADWVHGNRDMKTSEPYKDQGDYIHSNANVVSNKAYLIWSDWTALGINDSKIIDDMAHLFYRALYLLDSYATYNQWNWAMDQVAQYMMKNGDLSQQQYNSVHARLGNMEENHGIEKDFELLETIAVMLAEEYELCRTAELTDSLREQASILLIPKIAQELFEHTNIETNNVYSSTDVIGLGLEFHAEGTERMRVDGEAMFYYYAALYGEDAATKFMEAASAVGSLYYANDGEDFFATYSETTMDICEGWSWDITKTEVQDSVCVDYTATLISPKNIKYKIIFRLTQDAGGYTGAFLNGYYLKDMSLIFEDDDTLLLNWLDALVQQCDVINVGTEEYYSASGGFEHVVPCNRISGLLAAEMDDYDGDGSDELFVVRVDPETYKLGAADGAGTTYIVLEVYDVKDGEVMCSDRIFPLLGVSETWYHAAAHVFKVKDEDGIRLYFDHFFSFNSQSFATIQLEYIDGSLRVTDGAELSEFAYSASCYRAVSNEACGTILGRQSYDIGQDGWDEYCSGYWEDYGDEYEAVTWDTFQGYNAMLSNMGLTESVSRSMFWGDWDGGAYASLQAEYGRCYLRPADRFTADGGSVQAICSLIAPYGQGSVTLTVENQTDLLAAYQATIVNALNIGGNSFDSTAYGGYDSPDDVFNAVGDVFFHGAAEDMLELYADRQLEYCAAWIGCSEDTFRQHLIDNWEASWPDTSYILTFGMGETGAVQLSADEIESRFGTNAATPNRAARIQMNAYRGYSGGEPEYQLVIYAVCYDGRWYLSAIDG